jgi:uncharacterized protein YndB with AHSA1/START domain
MWQRSFSILASAPVQAVWKLFADVEGWARWNAGIESISIAGPFADGTEFVMKPPGQEAFTSRLVNVVEPLRFEDETVIGDIRVLVDHRVEPAPDGQVRITYTARVEGPGAEEVGAAVTDDFPAVLKALAALAEREAVRAR